MQFTRLDGAEIYLRLLRASDADTVAKLANNKKVARYIPHFPSPYTLKNAQAWVRKTRRLHNKETQYHTGVFRRADDRLVGMIGIRNLNFNDLNAEMGYWIAPRYWNNGYATEAIRLLLGFAFKSLRLRRVYAVVLSENIGSVRVLEKSGFLRESVMRKACRQGRRWIDVYAYGILKEEF